MAVEESLEDLVHDALDLGEIKSLLFLDLHFQVFFHVHVEELEDQIQFVLAVHNVNQVHDALVLQLPQQRNLSQSGAGYSFVAVLDFYLL